MNCQQIRPLLHAHHDGELDAANTLQVDQHLADCPHCFAYLRNLGTTRLLVRDEALRHRASPDLRRNIRAALAKAAEAEREPVAARSIWWRVGLPAAAAVLLGSVFLFWPQHSDDRLLAEVTSSHVRSLMVEHLTDVTSTDQHTVKPWFDGKLDYAPPVRDLRDSGFPLLGGRLDYLSGRSVAALVYGRQKHFINLFVWPVDRPGVASAPSPTERNGYHLVHWTSPTMTYWAASDLNEKELMDFARMLAGG
jgi:anti-sigma factor RsiW